MSIIVTKTDRTCSSCGKEFSKPFYLRRHVENRKTPCAPIIHQADEHANLDLCRFCGRAFASSANRNRHEKKYCKINQSKEGMDRLYEHTKVNQDPASAAAMAARLARMETEMAEMRELLGVRTPAIRPQAQAFAIQGDYAQVDNSQNFTIINQQTINVFGREQMDHISQAQVYSLLMKTKGLGIADAAAQAVLEAALLIYSDPAHPENITCYLPNKKTNEALVHGDQGWNIQPVDLVLTPMMQKSIDVLFAKQPFGGEEGLPAEPNISACGITLKGLMEFEKDPTQKRRMAGKEGQLRAVLIRNKDELKRALNTLPVSGSQQNQEAPAAVMQALGQPEEVV